MSESEDLVETICHRLFFRDFVVRNPKFRKPGGKQLEAADILVPFRDHLISIQVKSRASRKAVTSLEAS